MHCLVFRSNGLLSDKNEILGNSKQLMISLKMLALAVVSHVPNTLLSAKNSLTILCCPIMWVRK